MNYKKWLALFLALVVVVLVSAILPNKATEVEAQGLDLNRHCQQHGRERAINIDGTAYGWRCEDSQGQLHPMSIQDACNEQYGSGYSAQFGSMSDPNSWSCVAQSQPVNPTAVPPVNPPPSNPQTDQVRHEGIDLARYCQDKGLGTIVLIGTHARDWRCQSGSTYSGLNLQEACLMQHGLPHVGLLSDDPYGWFCSNQPETLVDGPESPLPGQSQSSQPTVADPGPAHGNQASDTRTSSGGCAIQSFTMSPQGPYVFGQHVSLEVRSTCGTVKFNVDGLDKAEIGSTSQVETWKTNETGVGTIHVCALARGDGGWSNAAYICYDVYVGPQYRVDAYRPSSNNSGSSSSSGDTACPSSPSRLSVGLLAVVNSSSINVRSSAGLSAGTLRSINRGQVVSVISGPQCRNGYRWWEIGTDGWSGWSAEVGSNGDYLLLPNGAPLSPSAGSGNNSQDQSSSSSNSSGSSGQTSSGSSLPGRNPTCSGAITPQMQVGMRGRVTYTDGSPTNLRDQPGGITRIAMPEGYEFIVVGGPTCHNNLNWWQLRTNDGTTGWSAEGRDGVYWIEPWENEGQQAGVGQETAPDVRIKSLPHQTDYELSFGQLGYDLNVTYEVTSRRVVVRTVSVNYTFDPYQPRTCFVRAYVQVFDQNGNVVLNENKISFGSIVGRVDDQLDLLPYESLGTGGRIYVGFIYYCSSGPIVDEDYTQYSQFGSNLQTWDDLIQQGYMEEYGGAAVSEMNIP